MNRSGISRRSLFGRLFGGIALAVGATSANAQIAGIEELAAEAPAGIVSYTFDGEGRLLGQLNGTGPNTGS